jgi:hypothetical protein
MARFSTPTLSGGRVADSPDAVGSAARSWLGLGRLLADRWRGAPPSQVVQLWISAREDEDRSLALRVRAATAADPLFR